MADGRQSDKEWGRDIPGTSEAGETVNFPRAGRLIADDRFLYAGLRAFGDYARPIAGHRVKLAPRGPQRDLAEGNWRDGSGERVFRLAR